MKRNISTEEHIIEILKEQDAGVPVTDLLGLNLRRILPNS